MRARSRPEVLAPAGDMDCIRAAVENGADAVYFGLSRHNARARATNFTLEELPELLAFLRLRGVKAYVAFNTLIFSDELDSAAEDLRKILAAGPDAIIVQDLGIMRLIRAMSPDAVIHASTQATITSAEQMQALRDLDVSRVILARELTLKDLQRIAPAAPLELEVFVHGALCVAYSGQCLTSEALGGRSANRGACAQACRLPYELVVDGRTKDLGERKYLLSPQDLAALDLIPELVDAGVSCFKIEGRLKTPEYVAATTRAYRKAVDAAWEQRRTSFSRDERLELQQVFSRGLTPAFLAGIDHQSLIPALSPKKRGPYLGTVRAIREQHVLVTLENPVKPGDGVSFDHGDPDHEEGGRITAVRVRGTRVESADTGEEAELAFYGELDWSKIGTGYRIWKSSDPALDRKLRATFEKPARRVSVDAIVAGKAGDPLVVELTDGRHRGSGATSRPLEPARKRPLTAEYLRGQLERLGATTFELRNLEVRLEGEVIVPVSEINAARRRAAEALEGARKAVPERRILKNALTSIRPSPAKAAPGPAEAIVLCRTPEQLRAILDAGFREVELDFEDIKKYREAVEACRAAGARVILAPPRIFKPGETGILSLVKACRPDGVLVRNLAHLEAFRGSRLIGDFSLNVANDLTADWWLRRGLEAFTPSYDLNAAQLEALLSRAPADRAEVVVHQHMPMFHLEHCVFAATMSTGHDSSDCGRPCDLHRVALRDRVGKEHALLADVGCRNTVYNAVPQSASPYVSRLRELGVRRFRIELLLQAPAEAVKLARAYADLLAGRRDGATLWRELSALDVLGVTRGPLGRED